MTPSRRNRDAGERAGDLTTERDSVSLGENRPSSDASLPAAPVPDAPKPVSGSIELKPSDLKRALKSPEGREILKALDPDADLASFSKKLFETDPASAHDSNLEFSWSRKGEWSSVALSSTRELANGKVVARVSLNARSGENARTFANVQYTPETFPTRRQLPDVVEKHWENVFEQSPEELVRQARERYGDLGEARDIRIFASGLDGEKPHLSFDWSHEGDGDSQINLRHWSGGSEIQSSLTAEQLKSGNLLEVIRRGWESWNLDPSEVAAQVVEGSGVKTSRLEVGLRTDDGGQRLTLGTTLSGPAGDAEEKTAGNFIFNLYETPGADGRVRRTAYHSLVSFGPEFQGKGLAKRILRNSFDLYKDLKIDKVDLTAAITVGGYAWARYGWQLTPQCVKTRELDKQIEARMETLNLKPQQRKVIEKLLTSDDPKKVWALSDLRAKVVKDGRETTLGKALLLGTHWTGTFDMHDPASTKRLERYIG